MRRRWFLGMACSLSVAARAADARIEVWVDLSLPALSTAAPGEPRAALKRELEAQQARVMAALRGLGAEEIGRVALLRNALAVRLPAAHLAVVRALPEVSGVRIVRDIERPPPKIG